MNEDKNSRNNYNDVQLFVVAERFLAGMGAQEGQGVPPAALENEILAQVAAAGGARAFPDAPGARALPPRPPRAGMQVFLPLSPFFLFLVSQASLLSLFTFV
jgi:hypothetical protein